MGRKNSSKRAQTRAALLSICASALLTSGCVKIDGGAVEARWVLRDENGSSKTCKTARIASIALELLEDAESPQTPCLDEPGCLFDCAELRGTTPFIIPPGDYAMRLVPIDEDEVSRLGEPDVLLPQPLVRSVSRGELTDLNVNLIIVLR